jgi:hypothetical protein
LEKAIKHFISATLFLLSSSVAFGEDLSSCTLKKMADDMNYCKASFAGSATFCDMIKNGEKKRECYFMVVKIQRNNAYQIKKQVPKVEEEK